MTNPGFLEDTDLVIDTEAARNALAAVGVAPKGVLEEAMVHAAADILLATNIARVLPEGAEFLNAVAGLKSMVTPQPLEVLKAQQRLLQGLMELPDAGTSRLPGAPAAPIVASRLARLAQLLADGVVEASTPPSTPA